MKIYGGAGNDKVTAGNGTDVVYGDGGQDVINAGNGQDSLNGGAGNDTITAGNGADHLYGNAGADKLTAGTGRDYLFGAAGNDIMRARGAVAFVNGGKGHNVAYVTKPMASFARKHGEARAHHLAVSSATKDATGARRLTSAGVFWHLGTRYRAAVWIGAAACSG